MRQTISALLIGFAGFGASMLLERYVTAVPEWAWRLFGLACIGAGIIGASLNDSAYAYLRGVRPQVLYLGFSLMFAAFGAAVFGLVVQPLLTAVIPQLEVFGTVSGAQRDATDKHGGIVWLPAYAEVGVTLTNWSGLDFENLDIVIRPDAPIFHVAQTTTVPNVTIDCHEQPTITPEVVERSTGKRQALNLVPLTTLRGYRLRVPVLPRKSRIEIVLAAAQPKIKTTNPDDYTLVINFKDGRSVSFAHQNYTQGVWDAKPQVAEISIEGTYNFNGDARPIQTSIKVIDFIGEGLKSIPEM